MSSSAITTQTAQLKIGSVQNQADSSSVYSAGVWSFKNSTAVTSVTITDAGNVGINAVSPTSRLTIGTGTFTAAAAQTTGMYTNGTNGLVVLTDAMSVNSRTGTNFLNIDASGNLLVGTTSNVGGYRLVSSISSTTSAILAENNSSSASGVGGFTSGIPQTANNTSCYHFRGVTNNVAIWYLYGNGTSSFTSDQRLKKNFEPARDGYAEDLCKLRVVKYHWNTNEDSEAKELGLIAQEVEQVFPGLVQEADVEFEGGLKPKVLKGSVLPFMLLKAIQEQQAMIKSMKAEIEALKAK